ncbi:hypothetical protein MIR68_001335 [Amoeboaphelidium protococcarum]|nr:hypothetical protein MIR68_001335 [Amoeboaphelidium protococcarum]
MDENLIDGIFCYSLGEDLKQLDQRETIRRSNDSLSNNNNRSRELSHAQNDNIPAHPFNVSYQPQLQFFHQSGSSSSSSEGKVAAKRLPQFAWMFCFPEGGLQLVDSAPLNKYHSFVMTDEIGAKQYAMCMTFYEPLTQMPGSCCQNYQKQADMWKKDHLSDTDLEYVNHVRTKLRQVEMQMKEASQEDLMVLKEKLSILKGQYEPYIGMYIDVNQIFVPRCLGIVSRWPFFGLFKDWLRYVHTAITNHLVVGSRIAFESYCLQLSHYVPLPPLGKTDVSFTMSDMRLMCSRPPANYLPAIRDFKAIPIIASIGVENLVRLFEFISMERKVLIMSKYAELLTPACELITSLMFPFYWHHIYVPVLPAKLVQYIHSPIPYIIGVQSQLLNRERPPSDVLIVDLDDHSMTYYAPNSRDNILSLVDEKPDAPFLPGKERQKLLLRLKKNFAVNTEYQPTSEEWVNYLQDSDWNACDVNRQEIQKNVLENVKVSLYKEYNKLSITVQAQKLQIPFTLKNVSNQQSSSSIFKRRSDMVPSHSRHISMEKTLPKVPELQADQQSSHSVSDAIKASSLMERKLESQGSLYTEMVDTFQRLQSSSEESVEYSQSGQQSQRRVVVSSSIDNVSILTTSSTMQSQLDLTMSGSQILRSSEIQQQQQQQHMSSDFDVVGKQKHVSMNAADRQSAASKKTSSFASISSWFRSNSSNSDSLQVAPVSSYQVEAFKALEPFKETVDRVLVNVHQISQEHPGYQVCQIKQYPEIHYVTKDPVNLSIRNVVMLSHSFKQLIVAFHDSSPSASMISLPHSSLPVGVCAHCSLEVRSTVVFTNALRQIYKGLEYLHFKHRNHAQSEQTASQSYVYVCTNCHVCVHEKCLQHYHCHCAVAVQEDKIYEAFVHCWSSLLKDYRAVIQSVESPEDYNKQQGMLAQFFDDGTGFMQGLFQTQAFTQFIEERRREDSNDYDVVLFDECINAKLNRSKLRVSQEATPFLDNQKSFAITEHYTCPQPEFTDMDLGHSIPQQLDQALLVPKRRQKKLLSDRDVKKLKVYTNSVLRKSRTSKSPTSEASKWLGERVMKALGGASSANTSDNLSTLPTLGVTKTSLNSLQKEQHGLQRQYGRPSSSTNPSNQSKVQTIVAEVKRYLESVRDREDHAQVVLVNGELVSQVARDFDNVLQQLTIYQDELNVILDYMGNNPQNRIATEEQDVKAVLLQLEEKLQFVRQCQLVVDAPPLQKDTIYTTTSQ